MEHQFAPAGMKIPDAEHVATTLQNVLADLLDLYLTIKHVHWNVVGPGFIAIHELMDTQYEEVQTMVDATAERITTLGSVAAGLPGLIGSLRSAPSDYPLGRAPVMAHLGALDKVYERVCADHRKATDDVSDLDPVSEDLLIGHTARLDLNHWFIRAHLEDTAGHILTEGTDDEMEAAVASARESDGLEMIELDETDARSTTAASG